MAIGMGAALLGSAIIGGGASILGGNASAKATSRAADAQAQATRDSLALQERTYNQNNALLSPYNERGNAAGAQINALLGVSPATTGVDWTSYVNNQADVLSNYQKDGAAQGFTDAGAFGKWHYGNEGGIRDVTQYQTGGNAQQQANNAFDIFRDSSGYQFRMDEGNKSLNALNAARGTLDSGSAVKSALQYGQNIGSQEFGNYMGYLGNQQGVGLSAASAVAGVGQNYANSVTGINQNNATTQGNLALQQGQNTNNMLGGLASSFGVGLGALTKFGQPQNALGLIY